MAMTMQHTHTIPVWDPAVRAGHWALVVAFAAAYLTGEGEQEGLTGVVHVWAGYAVGIIVALRVLWGLIGPTYARFADFVFGPVKVFRYLLDLVLGRAHRYAGHSPAGGAMVLALLLCLMGTVVTGLVAYGDQGKGPLASGTLGLVAQSHAEFDRSQRDNPAGRRPERAESMVGELHGTLANLTLALVVLHLLGVGLASVVHRENLVRAMVDGRKRALD